MKLWSCVVLLLLFASPSLGISGDRYLREEYRNVIRTKYQEEWDNPMTPEGKEKLDRLFDSTPFLNDPQQSGHSHRRKRAANEVKEEQLLIDGIMEYGSIPVDFSRQICMFQVEELEYAAVVHSTNISNPDNSTKLVIFRKMENRDFERIYNYSIPHMVSLDCLSFGSYGFVSVAVNIRQENGNTHLYSPTFSVRKLDQVEIVDTNTKWRIRTCKLWKYGNDLLLIYTYENDPSLDDVSGAYLCPIWKLSPGFFFVYWKEVPCSNAIRVEAFTIISDMYLAVANSRDASNNTETHTVVYKFDLNLDKFVAFQSIQVNRIVDIRHFTFKITDEVANFLVITSAGLIESNEVAEIRREGYSVIIIYKYVDEIFLPMQNILIEKPTQVLPHIWDNKEMVLLIASEIAPVQFYQYIGWKFTDSEIQEIPMAFETGVSSLRNYVNAKGDSIILLANSEHFGLTPNLFKIHFKVDEDPDLYQGILEWCEKSVTDLQGFDYERVLAELEAIQVQQEKILGDLVLNGPVTFVGQNVTLKKIVGDHVQDDSLEFSKEEHEKLIQIKKVVEELEHKLMEIAEKIGKSMTKKDRDESLRSAEEREVTFDKLQVKEIEAKSVNGVPVDLWAHSDQNLLVESLRAEQITVHGDVTMEQYKGIFEGALRSSGDQVIEYPLIGDRVQVDHLEIHESINENDIQAIVTALQQISTDQEEVSVDEVQVRHLHGLVNGNDFRELDRMILKSTGDQTIEGSFNLDNLVVGNSVEILGRVSGYNLANMITIAGDEEKELIFDKGVNFEKQPVFHDLHVKSRISSVNVRKNGGFDVLLKKSPHVQLMKGEVLFDEVKLMEPITLHGKIPNSPLNKMNPNVVVNGEVELTGDYEISGPVTVKRRFTTKDLFCSDEQRSLNDLKNYGILLNQTVIEGDMVFNQPIKVNNLSAQSIRNIPVESLLKSGLSGGPDQVVTGRKIFTSPEIYVSGSVDAANVNGVDIEEFSRTVLTRTGDQNITGNIHFSGIETISTASDRVALGGRDIRHFYARDKDIHVPGPVNFKGSLKPTQKLKIKALYPTRPVLRYNFTELHKDTVLRYETDVIVTGKKIFKDRLNIRNMKTEGAFANLSQVPSDGILGIELNGDLSGEEIKCSQLLVHEEMNGIPADQFGHLWLSWEGDQIFTKHQTFHNLKVDKIHLYGQLEANGIKYDISNAPRNTYLTNRREVVLPKTVFENVMDVEGNLQLLGSLNGLRVPEDLILGNSSLIDVLHVKNGDVYVGEELILNGLLNDVPLAPLFNFTLNPNPYLNMNLKVNGSVGFSREPLIMNVGEVNIDALYENAWMLYHSRDVNGDVDFDELHLAADVHAEVVNGRNLPHFVANRFSLKEPQRVVEKLNFVNEVVTHGLLKSDQLTTRELLIEDGDTNVPINLKYFSENSMKKSGFGDTLQLVTGNWHFKELVVQGDLQSVLINGLNLVHDVVHRGGGMSSPSNIVGGGRSFDNLHIENLACGQVCFVQRVNLNAWMLQAVYLAGNQSIQGITVLESPQILRNIRVFGSVNGLQFDTESVLTKAENQYLNVSLYVNNQFDDKLHQLTVHRLDTDQVNGQRIWQDQMDESVLVTLLMREQNVVESPVAFQQKLVVENLSLQGDTLFGARMRDVHLNMGVRKLLDEQTRGFKDLLRVVEGATRKSTIGAATSGGRYVKHFNIVQHIPGADLKYLEPIKRFSESSRFSTSQLWTNATSSSPPHSSPNDYLLIKIDGASRGRLSLLGYNATINKFNPVSELDMARDILALEILPLADGREIVFLQTTIEGLDQQQQHSYLNHLLQFDGEANEFRVLDEFQSRQEIRVRLLSTDSGDLLAQYSPLLDTVDLYQVKWLETGGKLALPSHGQIAKRGVKAVHALGRNYLALLIEKKQVEIWWYDKRSDKYEQKFVVNSLVDPVALATAPFLEQHLIAVQCAGNVVDISVLMPATHKLKRYQTLQINDQPLQLRFVRMTSGEMMLAVSTTNGQRPLVVYRYAGLSLFVERLGYSKLGTSGRRISDLIIDGGGGESGRQARNFMFMVAEREAVILEAITEQ